MMTGRDGCSPQGDSLEARRGLSMTSFPISQSSSTPSQPPSYVTACLSRNQASSPLCLTPQDAGIMFAIHPHQAYESWLVAWLKKRKIVTFEASRTFTSWPSFQAFDLMVVCLIIHDQQVNSTLSLVAFRRLCVYSLSWIESIECSWSQWVAFLFCFFLCSLRVVELNKTKNLQSVLSIQETWVSNGIPNSLTNSRGKNVKVVQRVVLEQRSWDHKIKGIVFVSSMNVLGKFHGSLPLCVRSWHFVLRWRRKKVCSAWKDKAHPLGSINTFHGNLPIRFCVCVTAGNQW